MNDFRKMLLALWNGLSGPQRLSIGATFFAALVGLAALIHFASRPQLSMLYSGLAPAEAQRVVEYLQAQRIEHRVEGTTIFVPGSRTDEVRLALAGQGIGRDDAGSEGWAQLDKPSFGTSDFMQRISYYRALQGELARTIRQIEGVESARVHITVHPQPLFSRDRQESEASVILKLRRGQRLGGQQVKAIRFLIASSVENLRPERVSVVDNLGSVLAASDESGGTGPDTAKQLDFTRAYEDDLRLKAQSLLDQALGPGQAIVRVTAEMDFDAVSETSERFDPRGQVPRSESTTTESTSSRTEATTSTVGAAANTQNTGDSGQTQQSTQTRETVTNQFEINRTVETRQRAGGLPRRVTTAVLLNLRRAPAAVTAGAAGAAPAALPRTPQELRAIEDLIKNAVGFTAAGGRQDAISVKEVEFTDLFAGAPAEPAAVPLSSQIDRWLPYASQAFLGLLAIAVFVYFRSVVRSSKGSVESREFSELLNRYDQLTAATVEATVNANKRALSVDDMQRLLRDNPANTAQAIKSWLGRN